MLAIASAIIPPLAWAGVGASVAALALCWRRHGADGLAADAAPRTLAVTAVVAAAVGATAVETALPLLLAGLVLLALIAAEPILAKVLAAVFLESAHLPIQRPPLERWFTPRLAYGAVTTLTGGVVLCGAALIAFGAGWASWTAAGLAVAAGLGFAFGTLGALRRGGSSAHAGDRAVRAAVAQTRPRFLVHLAGPSESTFHLRMWLQYFDRLGDPYVIVLRDRALLPGLVAATDTPIVVAPRIADVEALLVDSVRTVFYVNNSMENAQLVRTGRLTHIQLMHGDSDKLASRNPVSAMYDLVFVAGQAGIDRYRAHGVDIPDRRFRIVGRPQLHATRVGPRPDRDGAPVFLYTPTWAGTSHEVDYSSLRIGPAIVRAMLDRGATVLLRAHPFTRHDRAAARLLAESERLLAADAEASGRAHRWGKATAEDMSLAECIDAADYAVTDVSGAASDWLYSGKPFALTDMQDLRDDFEAQLPLARAAYRIDAGGTGVGEALDAMLGDDPLAGHRCETRTYYLGDFPPERYVEAFLEAARDAYRTGDDAAADAPAAPGSRPAAVEVSTNQRAGGREVDASLN